MLEILVPYLPTIVLILIAGFLIVADLIKGKNVYKDEKKRQKQTIIEEYQEEVNIQNEFQALHSRFDEICKKLQEVQDRMTSAENRLTDLTTSDMHDIKAWIVDQYRKFYIEQGWIDAFSAETIDRRYTDYKKEGGNSYIEVLIGRLHELPMDPPTRNGGNHYEQ